MKQNRVRQILREGGVAVGMSLMELATRGVPKILEFAGLDFVMIDMEHSGFGIDRVSDIIAWMRSTTVAPFVRVPENQHHFLTGVLDAGALGVQVSNIRNAAQARDLVDAVKYEPIGHRGLGLVAAHSDFTSPKAADYLPAANENTMVVVSIESKEALENVDEIAAVEGIDVLTIGINDMTSALGIHGQFDHPLFKEAIRTVIGACKRHGKAGRMQPVSQAQMDEYLELGFRLLYVTTDAPLFRNAVKSEVDLIRSRVAAAGLPSSRA